MNLLKFVQSSAAVWEENVTSTLVTLSIHYLIVDI